MGEKQLLLDPELGESRRKCPISLLLTTLLPVPPMDTEGQGAWVMWSARLAFRVQSKRKRVESPTREQRIRSTLSPSKVGKLSH